MSVFEQGFPKPKKEGGKGPNKQGSATELTVSTTDQAFPLGFYGGIVGDGKVKGEPNLVANNIRKGYPIGGVQGTAAGIGDYIPFTRWISNLFYQFLAFNGSGTISNATGAGSMNAYSDVYPFSHNSTRIFITKMNYGATAGLGVAYDSDVSANGFTATSVRMGRSKVNYDTGVPVLLVNGGNNTIKMARANISYLGYLSSLVDCGTLGSANQVMSGQPIESSPGGSKVTILIVKTDNTRDLVCYTWNGSSYVYTWTASIGTSTVYGHSMDANFAYVPVASDGVGTIRKYDLTNGTYTIITVGSIGATFGNTSCDKDFIYAATVAGMVYKIPKATPTSFALSYNFGALPYYFDVLTEGIDANYADAVLLCLSGTSSAQMAMHGPKACGSYGSGLVGLRLSNFEYISGIVAGTTAYVYANLGGITLNS